MFNTIFLLEDFSDEVTIGPSISEGGVQSQCPVQYGQLYGMSSSCRVLVLNYFIINVSQEIYSSSSADCFLRRIKKVAIGTQIATPIINSD